MRRRVDGALQLARLWRTNEEENERDRNYETMVNKMAVRRYRQIGFTANGSLDG